MKKSLAGLTLFTALAAASAARADVAVSVGGQIAVGGSVGVTIGAPRWHRPHGPAPAAAIIVDGSVYAYGYGYGEFAEPPPPPPPPEACCCCEPPPPPPPTYYAPPPAPAASVVMVAQPRPRRIGLGVRLSSTRLSGDQGPEADGVGALLRLRGHRAELELELGQDHFRQTERVDTRVGGTVYLHLMQTRLRPYLLVGGGLNSIDNYYGRPDAKQGYLEGGAGLLLRLGHAFSLNGDLRWSSRHVLDEEDAAADYHMIVPAPEKERGFEGRLAGVFYF